MRRTISQLSRAAQIANARSYEEERRRAEALAAIDRAKTAFFSNVSHEFRTPLTLMLGPLEDALRECDKFGAPEDHQRRLDLAHRNGLRLLRLVNTLLDFSRIEAGRAQASYEPTDLATLTADIASGFRAVTDHAGLVLAVDCDPTPEPIYVDRDMWEKVVLNLLSNAFKFTFEGGVFVRLRSRDGRAELSVRDTGVGIPEHELPHVFDRFHRIEGQRSRSYEGSGIGLALVQDLVRLHGGAIEVRSKPERGTEFIVTIPLGRAHLDESRINGEKTAAAATSTRAEAFVEEALRWLPEAPLTSAPAPSSPASARDLILLADDNADMRDYVRRLLESRYDVVAVPDGEAALRSIKERRPSLVLADVMMPGLDGFELAAAIRNDAMLRNLPIIFLSARAGEEASVEGLQAGADDYLVKPFSANELIARIGAHLALARVRREAAQALEAKTAELQAVLDTAPAGIWFTYDADTSQVRSNRYAADCLRVPGGANPSLTAPSDGSPTHLRVYGAAGPISPEELPLQKAARGVEVRDFELEIRFEEGAIINLLANASPLRDGNGKVRGAVAVGVDITARKEAERSLRRERQLLQTIIDRIPVMITLYEPDAKLLNINREFTRVTGWAPEDIRGVSLMEEFYPDPAYRAEVEAFMNACKDGWMDIKMRRRDGALIDTTWANIALADGRRVGIGADIGERKRSERQRLSLINELNHRVKNTLATVQSIAMQTMRGAADSQEAFLRFEARLVALARAHDVLTKENWEGADLRSVVERVLEPFRAERDRFTVRGDSVRLAPRHALALAMAFHELATNAVKYGSLSADGGEVEVEWSALAARSAVALVWREKNGPPVRGPVRKGFGSRLLEKSLAHDLGAAAEIEFRASGVVVKLTAPYENMWR